MTRTANQPDWLGLLRVQTQRFADVVEHGDLTAPVTSCPGWTLRDLADHLGGVHQWAAHAVVEGNPRLQPMAATAQEASGLAGWYVQQANHLLDVLASRSPETRAWTMNPDDASVGFWRRRQVHEVTLHLWDAEQARGTPGPIDPALAWDGVAEVVDILYPRQVRLGRTTSLATAVRLTAVDLDEIIVIGDGEPVDVRASAEVLLRLLWHRTADHEVEPASRALLAGALTP